MVNEQYSDPPFGLAGDYTSTGAPGSAVASPGSTQGAVIGSPVVSTPYASSQAAENMPRVPVTSGDTSGMSSDGPVPGTDPLTGLSLGEICGTGADGARVRDLNPTAQPVPPMAAQIAAALRP